MAELNEFFPQEAAPSLDALVPTAPAPEGEAHRDSMLNQAGYAAYLNAQQGGGNLEGDYRAVAGDFTSSGKSPTFDSITAKAMQSQEESNKKALTGIVTDPSIPVEKKIGAISYVKNGGGAFDTVMSAIAENAIIAESPGETKTKAKVRIDSMRDLKIMRRTKALEATVVSDVQTQLDEGTLKLLGDLAPMVIPFASSTISASQARQTAEQEGASAGRQGWEAFKAFFASGESKAALADKVNSLDPTKREEFILKTWQAAKDRKGVLFGSQNQFEAMSRVNAAVTGHYPISERIVDDAIVLLDALGAGGVYKAGKAILKGATATKAVEATGIAGKATQGTVGAPASESMIAQWNRYSGSGEGQRDLSNIFDKKTMESGGQRVEYNSVPPQSGSTNAPIPAKGDKVKFDVGGTQVEGTALGWGPNELTFVKDSTGKHWAVEPGDIYKLPTDHTIKQAPDFSKGFGGARLTVESVISNATRNAIKSETSPISVSQILKDTNPSQARNVHALVAADKSGEAAQALYGASREDAIAHDILPNISDGAGGVSNKVGGIGSTTPLEIDPTLARVTRDEAMLQYTEAEKDSKRAAVVNNFMDNVGVTSRTEMFFHEGTTDGVRISGVYGPSEGGYLSAQEATDSILYAGKGYGLTEENVTILQRVADRYLPVKLEDVAHITGGDFLASIKYEYKFNATSIAGNFTGDTNAWNILGRIRWGGGKWFGDVKSNLLDAPSFIDPRVMASSFAGVGKTVGIERALARIGEDFAKGFAKLDKGRQAVVDSFIRKANELGLDYTPTAMRAAGLDKEGMDLMQKWKRIWDNTWHLENKFSVEAHVKRGYGMFVDVQNGVQLIAREIKTPSKAVQEMGSSKNLHVFDSVINDSRPMTAFEIDNLYKRGGNISELRNPISTSSGHVKYVINENKAGNSYVRALNNSDKVLGYRPGYYQVHYKDPIFIIKTVKDKSGNVIGHSAIATSETEINAKRIVKNFTDNNTDPAISFTHRKDVKMEDALWDQAHARGRTAQMNRGQRLETSNSNTAGLAHENILDPVEALTRSIRSVSVRTSMGDIIEAQKQRFIQLYGHLYKSEEKGMKRMPESRAELNAGGKFNNNELANARDSLEFIRKMEEGYVNAIDEASKAAFDIFADAISESFDGRFANAMEKSLRVAGRAAPMNSAKHLASTLMIALNPARQLVLNSHQAIRVTAIDPLYVAKGTFAKDWMAYIMHTMGGDKFLTDKFLKGTQFGNRAAFEEAMRYMKDQGVVNSVDANVMVMGELQKLAATTAMEKVGRGLGAPVRFARRVGFDLGEQVNQVSSWLVMRNQVAKEYAKSGKVMDAEGYAMTQAKGINFSGGMNRAGTMPYAETVLGTNMQFMQIAHKMLLQDFTNKMLTTGERARLLAFDTIMFGGPIGATVSVVLENHLPEDRDIRRTIKTGFEEVILNKLFSLGMSSKSNIDFSALSPVSPGAISQTVVEAMSSDIGSAILMGGPAGSLFFGDNPKITNLVKAAARYTNIVPDFKAEGLDETNLKELLLMGAKLTSGGSNMLKAIHLAKTEQRINSWGINIGHDDNFWSAYMQVAGFGSREEAMSRPAIMEAYEKSAAFKEDVTTFTNNLLTHMANNFDVNQRAVEPQAYAAVMEVFGHQAIPIVRGIVEKRFKEDIKLQQTVNRASGWTNTNDFKNLIINAPEKAITPEQRSFYLKRLEEIENQKGID